MTSTAKPVDQKPNLQTALAFLNQVKSEMPVEYDTFLDILTQFRSKTVGAENVVNIVLELLVGRECLLEGFSQFLPPSCRDSLLERCSLRPATSISKDAKTTKKRPTTFESLVGLPPQEPKRKRESAGDMDLRPGALVSSGYSLGRKMTQQQIYQAQLKRSLLPPNMGEIWPIIISRIEMAIDRILAERETLIPSIDTDDIIAGRVFFFLRVTIKLAAQKHRKSNKQSFVAC
mmetsp:Transcript_72065/g.192591  ORF Transcript_72065/g.192591 Transcript_72065/m.192591 type:complete len:232 (+) Transcript_72065:106-801(+)